MSSRIERQPVSSSAVSCGPSHEAVTQPRRGKTRRLANRRPSNGPMASLFLNVVEFTFQAAEIIVTRPTGYCESPQSICDKIAASKAHSIPIARDEPAGVFPDPNNHLRPMSPSACERCRHLGASICPKKLPGHQRRRKLHS